MSGLALKTSERVILRQLDEGISDWTKTTDVVLLELFALGFVEWSADFELVQRSDAGTSALEDEPCEKCGHARSHHVRGVAQCERRPTEDPNIHCKCRRWVAPSATTPVQRFLRHRRQMCVKGDRAPA